MNSKILNLKEAINKILAEYDLTIEKFDIISIIHGGKDLIKLQGDFGNLVVKKLAKAGLKCTIDEDSGYLSFIDKIDDHTNIEFVLM